MLVRYPPSEIQAELLSNTSMHLFRIYSLLAFNCVSLFRHDAPLNAAQNVPLNAAQGVGKNVAQDGGQNAAKLMVRILFKLHLTQPQQLRPALHMCTP